MKKFPFIKQLDSSDSGPACIKMIARYYGKMFSSEKLREDYFLKGGPPLEAISKAAESIGLRSSVARISFEKLINESQLPCIVQWKQDQCVVVYRIQKKYIDVADPAFGLIRYTKEEFFKSWAIYTTNLENNGSVLFLQPTPLFYQQSESTDKALGFRFFFYYLIPYKKYFVQIFLGMMIGAGLQLIFPFLTQSIVEVGINNQDISFINLILLAQTMLFFSRTVVDFIRSWIILHVGGRVNIAVVSDFLIKLMKLPISFFDSKMIGDLLQRIGDHQRIQSFVSYSTLNTIFSFISLLVFSIVLWFYSLKILLIFFAGSLFYIIWIVLFMKKRKELDYKFFERNSKNQNALIQLISGIRDIKLHNSERKKRWEWERLQAQLFKMNISSLRLSQFQQTGTSFINEIKNIIITITSAKLVIDGEITLGMMLSVQYIIGQLNGPIGQLIGLINSYQDAKISLDRLGEIHNRDDEQVSFQAELNTLPFDKTITLNQVSFQYGNSNTEWVLNDINLTIPVGEVTAIVGSSGSGKTTLLKLLLKFYNPTHGKITVDGVDINKINNYYWRENCGAVLPDGTIFSDSISRNIALSDETADYKKLLAAARMANIHEFIESLPLGYETKIGNEGHGLSQGQRQRILIARAVYKQPKLILFDEATSALDATNERIIMNNLLEFFKGRTVLLSAHRLSTIKNAKKIVVMDNGKLVEEGDHQSLIARKGPYYNLVQNQLETVPEPVGNS